jgi:hypothetical protein
LTQIKAVTKNGPKILPAASGRETEQMFRRVFGMLFSIMLVGAIWAVRPLSNPFVSAAQAQTAADYPSSFTNSLVERSSDRVGIRRIVYVGAYSSVRLGGGKGKVDLATTLSIHNTSNERALNVERVDYFDTAGNLVHNYLPKPITIRPFGTVEAFVPAENTRGGTGANFIVEWSADGLITDPLIETVMVGALGAQGFAFTSRGKPMIKETP